MAIHQGCLLVVGRRMAVAVAVAILAGLAAGAVHAQADMWRDRVAMPAGRALWGSNVAIENRPCCEPTGRASSQETPVLAALAGRASRLGRTLRLRLDGGRTLRFVDCDTAAVCDVENVRLHRLAGWWPEHGYYVVAVSGYVDQMAYLVRERDGLIVRTLAPPILSPEGHYAIATDLIFSRGPGSTEVLDMGADPPVPVPFRTSATCPALLAAGSLPHWLDEQHARFSDAMLPASEPKPKDLILRIEGGAAEWVCKR